MAWAAKTGEEGGWQYGEEWWQNADWSDWQAGGSGWDWSDQVESVPGEALGDGLAQATVSPGKAAATAESLLDALAPDPSKPEEGAWAGTKATAAGRLRWVAGPRSTSEDVDGVMSAEKLLGHWVDSKGNAIHVMNTDAFDMRLVAALSRPPRPDIQLAIRPVMMAGGWQCGHSLLDPAWSSEDQMHWVALDGQVSVWVRPQDYHSEDHDGSDKLGVREGGERAPPERDGDADDSARQTEATDAVQTNGVGPDSVPQMNGVGPPAGTA
mmetsp:Transcript_22396/g.63617  ORF Transcript_22396/g.63617 Transcript_22396/m.63617 type:complete len:268 (-) Transcript_22396:237-1040(-)